MTECFQIDERDNIATLLQAAAASEELALLGETHTSTLRAMEAIPAGHKVAVQPISAGEPVVKYGYPIGEATRQIRVGEWVHLHNCRSRHDKASSMLDVDSGTRTETHYV